MAAMGRKRLLSLECECRIMAQSGHSSISTTPQELVSAMAVASCRTNKNYE